MRVTADLEDLPSGYTPVGSPVKILPVVDPETRELLSGFESLGGDCEFGLVQRRYQSEPLGLFRWSNIALNFLIEMLETRFAGLGDEDRTTLYVADWGEIFIRDLKYNSNQHTFVHEKGVDRDKFLLSQRRRLSFLARLMVEGLEDGKKVFLYKSNAILQPQWSEALFRAIAAYNPTNRLLFVEPPGEGGAITHHLARCGLLFARIPNLGPQQVPEGGARWDIPFDNWVALCRAALQALPPVGV